MSLYFWTERIMWNFYVTPDRNKTVFEHKEEVPNFLQEMVPLYIVFIVLEKLFLHLQHGKPLRINDGINSISHGALMTLMKIFTGYFEIFGYTWLYDFRLVTWDWRSAWTWWAAAVGVDFCYYWVHRMAHEISLFWCGHQVHHSSEDYNLATAVRQSCFQHFFTFGFYHPLALMGIPPAALLVHFHFNLFVQFWIHTEIIKTVGPFEWIFNTPSHHRVHHGINKWCLDKNYAGFLIIWDRMFGTFEAERPNEQIVYGLVNQPQKFEPIYQQTFYFRDLWNKARSMTTWGDVLRTFAYGPGWNPGTPRLGDENALPHRPPPRDKNDPQIPIWTQIYLLMHFLIVILVHQTITAQYMSFNWWSALLFIVFILVSLSTIGSAFDSKSWLPVVEVARCLATAAALSRNELVPSVILNTALIAYFILSALVWTMEYRKMTNGLKSKIQ